MTLTLAERAELRDTANRLHDLAHRVTNPVEASGVTVLANLAQHLADDPLGALALAALKEQFS